MVKYFSLFIFTTCLIALHLTAQSNFSLENLNVKDGLSNNSATCILQDHFGFMWIGTYDGLNRYDGVEFKVFRNHWQDSSSLINNHVVALKENNNHSIWVGTLKGVSLFDYNKFTFIPVYYYLSRLHSLREVDSRVREILIDSNKNTLIATENNGLLVEKNGAHFFEQVTYNHTNNFNASAICIYNKTEVFLSIKDVGLCIYNTSKNKISLVTGALNDITKLLYKKKENSLIVGTENGLFVYQLNTGKVQALNAAFTNSNITNLLVDKEGNTWVSTDGNGVAILPFDKDSVHFIKGGFGKGFLGSDAVYAVYEDSGKRKWIATLRGGVSVLNTIPNLFNTIKRDPYKQNTLVSNFTLSFCEDDKNNIWIGTDGGGLSYWNPRTNNYINYVHNPSDPKSLAGNYVVSVLKDFKGRVWVATFNGGIDLFDRKENNFIHYHCYNPIRNKYDINLWKLYQDSHHHIWAGSTRGDALFLYNEAKGQFELFDDKLINIHTFYEDKDGDLWAGDYSQLIKIDTLHKNHFYVNIGFAVRAIIQDNSGLLWLGTEGGGLFLYNKIKRSFIHFTEEDGLPSNSILNLLKDKNGNIWGSTYNGLFEYDIKSKKFINYTAEDGLQSNQFSYNAALKLKDGEFLFGGIGGFNKFFPERINRTRINIPIFLTDFEINNVPIEKTIYLDKNASLVNLKSVTIPYNKATLSINFTGLDYSEPGNIFYTYFLEGWDKGWTKPSKTRNAYYSRLYEGNYKLHIRVVNSDGSWNGGERIISIKVLSPWYRSGWAYLLYIVVFAAVIYVYLKYKQRQTKLEYEVKLAKINAAAEKDLNERKISFFTNISHEFRTMLTLIINPIKELMNSDDEVEKPEAVKIAYKNSKRMLSLVGQLLLFRKADNEESVLRVSKINLFLLCKEVFESFGFQAKTKKIDFQFSCVNESVEIYGDFEKIEIVLFNLLSNAMKYTPENGRVSLEVKEQNESVEIIISDSGKGIPQHIGEKVFEKYYQIHTLESSAKTGFGIGLFLVKEFINKHHGQISFSSEGGIGTTFYISLLKGKAHFNGIPIVESEEHERGLIEEIMDTMETDDLPLTETEQKKSSEGQPFITEKKSILIADDNHEIRNYIYQIFAKEYNIIEADNGKSALVLVRKNRPDLIILDLIMPGLYGDELCQIIKSDDTLNHIPIIMLTAEVSTEIKLRCVESGADDYITKPFDKDLLIARVHNLLKTKNSLQRYFFNQVTLQENDQRISLEDKDFLEKCISIVESHLEDDRFEVKVIADELYISHSSLYKKIHQISGYSVSGFVRFVRLRKAAELFINSSNNVGEIAYMVGFNDVKYFRSQFQKLFELTPSAYIKKYRKPFKKDYTLKKTPKQNE